MPKEKKKDGLEKLKELIDIVKGRKDIKHRLQVLTNPQNLDTMTILTKEEAHFLGVTNWLVKRPKWGLMFTGLNELAQAFREPNISISGGGRKDAIEFVRALNEAKILAKIEGKTRGDKD